MQETKRCGFDPWVRKIPWKRAWQPTAVFLPGKSHGQRSLAGYSPWGRKESDTTEQLSTAQHVTPLYAYTTHTHTIHPSQTHTPLCRHFFSTYHTYLIHTPYILLCSLFHDLYPLQSPSLHGLASFVFIFTCIGRFWNRLQM